MGYWKVKSSETLDEFFFNSEKKAKDFFNSGAFDIITHEKAEEDTVVCLKVIASWTEGSFSPEFKIKKFYTTQLFNPEFQFEETKDGKRTVRLYKYYKIADFDEVKATITTGLIAATSVFLPDIKDRFQQICCFIGDNFNMDWYNYKFLPFCEKRSKLQR